MTITLKNFLSLEQKNAIKCNHQIFFQDAINIKNIPSESVDLVITSPPYWKIKDYGNENQLGFNDSLNEYMLKLTEIFKACVSALKPNSKLCINIGDQFIRANTSQKKVYQIIPLHAMIINSLITEMNTELVYIGSIQWEKITHSKTSGGGQIMGSYPFPKSGYFFINREYIAIFRKMGKILKKHRPDPILRNFSRLTLEEWRSFFKDVWKFNPADQKTHMAMFPEELPRRLIKMYSFVGDTVLDPFLGSGTTIRASSNLGRNSIGYEIGFKTKDGTYWKKLLKSKVQIPFVNFEYPIEILNDSKKMIKKRELLIQNRYYYGEKFTPDILKGIII